MINHDISRLIMTNHHPIRRGRYLSESKNDTEVTKLHVSYYSYHTFSQLYNDYIDMSSKNVDFVRKIGGRGVQKL